jgi:ABC-type transport system substrate-binding protein
MANLQTNPKPPFLTCAYPLFFLVIVIFLIFFCCCDFSAEEAHPDENVLFSALSSKIRSLDPADISDTTSTIAASQIFETLYQYHYLKRPYQLVCQLAESLPQVSDNGLVYTIKIKKDVFYADDKCFPDGQGRELKAQDFVYAWKRIADIKNLSSNWWIFKNRIVGLDQFRQLSKKSPPADYNTPVEGLSAPDDYTLQIKLTKPWPQLSFFLAMIPTAPVPKEAVSYYGLDIINNPVGTGPFRLKRYLPGAFLDLEKNNNFRQDFYPSQGEPSDESTGCLEDAGKKLPLADKVLLTIIEEDQPRWFLFLQGKIDLCSIPQESFSLVLDSGGKLLDSLSNRGISLKTFDDPSTFWLGFNMEDNIVANNKPLRLAINFAVDKQLYNRLFFGNTSPVAYGFIPPLFDSFNPEIQNICGIDYDPQKAKILLKEAEKLFGGKLPRLTLSVPGTASRYRAQADFFRHCFNNVGLDVDIEYLDWPTFQDKLRKKQLQLFLGGFIAQYPDPVNFLELFYSGNTGYGINCFNYANPEFDKIFEQVSLLPDSNLKTDLCRKAEAIVIEDIPAVFLRHGRAFLLQHNWLYNSKPHAFGYGLSKYRRIANQQRNAYKKLYGP